MKLKNFLAVFSAVVLASVVSVSCQPKDDGPEEPTLTLSKQTLTLDNQAQNPTEPQVQVTTNQSKWNVSTNASWLTATRKGEGIVVGAEANTLGKDRKAEVVVYAGGLVEKIAVTQSASKIFFNVSSEKIEAPANGGQFLVAVETNAEKWEFEVEQATWLNVSKAGDFVKIDVMANDTDKARETKVFVKVGTETKSINVSQATNVEVVYFPFIDGDMTVYERAKKEAARGSLILRVSEPGMGFFGPQPGSVTLIPKADGFITSDYNVPFGTPLMWDQIVVIADSWKRISEGPFIDKLVEEGFAKDDSASKEDVLVYDNKTKRVKATILSETDGENTIYGVIFQRYYVQEKDYPTFSEMPGLLREFLDNKEKKVEDIVNFLKGKSYKMTKEIKSPRNEAEIGTQFFEKEGTVGKEEAKDVINFYHYTGRPQTKDPALVGSLYQYALAFTQDKINLALWLRPDGVYYPTKEFLALKDKAGFNANSIERNGQYFYVSKDDLVIMIRAAKFSDINPGEVSLQFAMWYEAGASEVTNVRLSDYVAKDKKEADAKYEARLASLKKAQAKIDSMSLK